jgi:hypothetical protein
MLPNVISRRKEMKKNLGLIDRVVRVAFAVAVLVLYLAGQLSTAAAIVLGVIAVVLVVTSVVGMCPIYALLGISSRGKKAA